MTPNRSDSVTPIEAAAKALYARVLSQWAIDLMMLRRDGLDVPSARLGDNMLAQPAWSGAYVGHGESMRWTAKDNRENLRWTPVAKIRKAA
ncbi:MAG: hypothetical protein U0640_11500 [Phycisphaerales bacterium]